MHHKQDQESGAPTAGTKANKLLCLLLIVTVILTQSACWDKVEVEQLAIVLAIALDKGKDGNVKVIVQTINPNGLAGGSGTNSGGGGPAAYRNIGAEGRTIFDAVRAMGSTVPRQLYFSHNQVIIISEELAREGIIDLMDFFDRNPQIRRSNWVLISKQETDQRQLLDAANPLEVSPAGRIERIIEQRSREPVYAPIKLGDLLEKLSNKGSSVYTAGVSLSFNRAIAPNNPANQQGSSGQVNPLEINLSGTAVFKQGRMAGWLDEGETKGLLWVKEGLTGGVHTVNLGGKGKQVSLEITNTSTNMAATVDDAGEIMINVDIKAEANVAESRAYLDYKKPESLLILQQLLAARIKQEIEMALAKTQQEYHSDVFGFGAAVYRKYPQYWKQIEDQWEDTIYPDVPVVINVKTEIPRTGLVSEPIKHEER
jgi:spore germination protein KC